MCHEEYAVGVKTSKVRLCVYSILEKFGYIRKSNTEYCADAECKRPDEKQYSPGPTTPAETVWLTDYEDLTWSRTSTATSINVVGFC